MPRDVPQPGGTSRAIDTMPLAQRGRPSGNAPYNVAFSSLSLRFVDGVVVLVVAGLAAVYAWWASGPFRDERLWSAISSLDVYFHADLPSFFDYWISGSPVTLSHFAVHPLMSPFGWAMGAVSRRTGLALSLTLRSFLCANAALSAALLYLCARGIGTGPLNGLLAVIATSATAAFTHWVGVPEHFAFSMTSIALPLMVLAVSNTRRLSVLIPAALTSGTITISNAMMGLLVLMARCGIFGGVVAFAASLLGLAMLAGAWLLHVGSVLGRMFSRLDNPLAHLRFLHFVPSPDPGHPKVWARDFPFDLSARVKGLTLYLAASPQIDIHHRFSSAFGFSPTVLSYDGSPLASLGWSGGIAAVAFAALFALGLASAARSPRRDVAVSAIGFLAFHFLLHLFYGELVFLYAAHAIPSLAAIVAFALAGPWRRPATLLALTFVLIGGPHNVVRYAEAADLAVLVARINLVGAEP